MTLVERGISFACEGCWLYGVLSLPGSMTGVQRGVVIVVGGPQYRAGSHRQFTLLARELAQQGVPVLRFDYRGMGDSEGDARDFLDVGADLRAAIDAFMVEAPGLQEVVLWGLCDAASAAMLYAPSDPRVAGMVLLNPWARTEEGVARAYLKHYYLSRLLQGELWRKIVRGQFSYAAALRSFLSLCLGALRRGKVLASDRAQQPALVGQASLPDQMLSGFSRFEGKALIIVGGADLTGREFLDMAKAPAWRKLIRSERVSSFILPQADHTFSRPEWRDQVARWTGDWLQRW